jgi:periplasmic protein CpxP/Spy
MMAKLPTPRRVDLINAEMDQDVAAMRRQGEAVKAFYAQLTPQQQSTFDRVTAQAQAQGEGAPQS